MNSATMIAFKALLLTSPRFKPYPFVFARV
jgi:hypothetical protein